MPATRCPSCQAIVRVHRRKLSQTVHCPKCSRPYVATPRRWSPGRALRSARRSAWWNTAALFLLAVALALIAWVMSYRLMLPPSHPGL